ncbi:ATP-binding cassette domain-containing protein [Nakamurella sp. YIM 132087]|uniref:ATP-binding cassette domain-containing protein n=1 Tax=Nakamurella alba TaxID=2665158 RepID=A0A7K1FQL1_9ACTN|nr:ATP-binding cassette domain-containing protein [Nakamurella alba]MTD15649.1 ATP-binding cassette domain-containing protein [Nakamurella alba]
MSQVRVRGLCKSYADRTVLDGVDLDVAAGSVLALLGPNGAGKTTVVRILATLTPADAGEVAVAGHDLHADPAAVRRAIAVTGQFAAVDGLLTPRENLRLIGRLARIPAPRLRTDVDELLERLDLTGVADRLTRTASGGTRRRVDLAVSLLTRPQVLFLDEPTTGLDPRSRQALWDLVDDLVAGGTAVLLTTQYLQEADRPGGRVAVLDGGRIVAEGAPAELRQRVGADVLEVTFTDGSTARVPVDGTFADLRRAMAGVEARLGNGPGVASFAVRTPSLDDVFLQLTGRRDGEVAA